MPLADRRLLLELGAALVIKLILIALLKRYTIWCYRRMFGRET